MTPEQIQAAVERENARDKKKFIVLAVFTAIWIVITMVNNIFISKKAEGAVSWGSTLITNDKQVLLNQQVIIINESNIISNQQHIEKRLIDIQNELDSKKPQPFLSPKAKSNQVNIIRSSNLMPFQSSNVLK